MSILAIVLVSWAAVGKKAPAPEAKPAASAPKVQVAVESLLDRRTTSDFPHPSLSLTLTLQGEDALAVRSARPRLTRAVDDTGRDLANPPNAMTYGQDGWQQAQGEGAMGTSSDVGTLSCHSDPNMSQTPSAIASRPHSGQMPAKTRSEDSVNVPALTMRGVNGGVHATW